jgi:elongation factor P
MKTAQELRVGNVIMVGKRPDGRAEGRIQQVRPQLRVVKMKFKNLLTGAVGTVYKADDKFEVVVLDRKEVTYSYFADPMYVFMDADYNQYEVEADNMTDALKYLEDGLQCEVVFYNGKAISVELPTSVVREVVYTEPAVKGDTSGKVMKPAKISHRLRAARAGLRRDRRQDRDRHPHRRVQEPRQVSGSGVTDTMGPMWAPSFFRLLRRASCSSSSRRDCVPCRLSPSNPLSSFMNASRLLLALAASVLVVACAPEPAPAPKVEQAAPAPEAPRGEAAEARREAAEAAREAMQKAGEAARKIGEAGSAAVEAAVRTAAEKAASEFAKDASRASSDAGALNQAPDEDRGGDGRSPETARDAKEAAEQAAHRIAEATRDVAERLREVGKGALESMRARTEPTTQEAAPVEERAAVPPGGGKEPAGR